MLPSALMYFSRPSQAFRAAGPYVCSSSHPFCTPVTIAKANMPVPDVSGHDSGMSSNWRHSPSSPCIFSSDAIIFW